MVAVIIVNYRCKELTAECARSAMASRGVDLRLVIVDNASGDGSLEYLRAAVPGAVILSTDKNRGYTGGNNAGLEEGIRLGARFAFVLNNDTRLHTDCLRHLVAEAEADSRVAMVCPRIFCDTPPDTLWFGGSRFSLWTGRAVHVGWKKPERHGLRQRCDIPFATGCAVLVRLSTLQEIGLLDESLFGYAEDLDWSLRARRAGYRLRYVPAAVLWHLEGIGYRRAGGQALRQYLSARNLLRVMARYMRWYHWVTFLPVFLVDHLGRFSALAIMRREWQDLVATYRGVWHAIVGGRHRIEPTQTRHPTS